MTFIEKVLELPPHWANDTIRPFDEELYREALPFVTRRYWCDSASVNVFRIVGTRHPDYRNMNWGWMIEHGKRMSENLALHGTNPGYYLETGRKLPEMTYITLDDLDFYVNTDGNHRSTIARFDFHYRGLTTLHGVTVEDVRIDREMIRLLEEGILSGFVAPFSEKLSREDTAGWMMETFRTGLRIRSKGTEQVLEKADQVREWIRERTECR
ncbi:hypothetical protein [Leptospirillum ferriphilum]|uniref:hypothetical protein n=1 Tax=Leptospirillum ferriphilum TaxID=178606 RepID=UPI0012370D54|nr:hypothetical protein [Leptospirillum ferriphilum]